MQRQLHLFVICNGHKPLPYLRIYNIHVYINFQAKFIYISLMKVFKYGTERNAGETQLTSQNDFLDGVKDGPPVPHLGLHLLLHLFLHLMFLLAKS